MKKSLEEEIKKRKLIEKQLNRLQSRSKNNVSTEESMRASELEIENEKLRKDFQMMRNSINRGVESQELQGNWRIQFGVIHACEETFYVWHSYFQSIYMFIMKTTRKKKE